MHASIVNSFPTDPGARPPSALPEHRDTGDFHRVLDRTLRDEPLRRDPSPPETERRNDVAAKEGDDAPPRQRDSDIRPKVIERQDRPDGNSPAERVAISDSEPETAGAAAPESQDAGPVGPGDAAVQDATSGDDAVPPIAMTGTILPIETPQSPKTEVLDAGSAIAVSGSPSPNATEGSEVPAAGSTESPPIVPATPAAEAGKASEPAPASPASVDVNSEVADGPEIVPAASALPTPENLVEQTGKEGLPAVAASGTPRRPGAGPAATPAIDEPAVEMSAEDGEAIDEAREPKAANGTTASTPTANANTNATQEKMQAGAPVGEKSDTARIPEIPSDRLLRADAQNASASEVRAAPPASPTTPGASPATSFASELRAAADISAGAAVRMTPQPAIQQLAVQISRANEAGQDRLTVNLKPADLGSVSIRLELGHDNRVIAMIQAERPDTLDLLQRDARTLERALADAGMNTDSGSLNFSLQNGGAGFMSGDDAGTGRTASLAIPDSGIESTTPTLYAPADDGTGVDIKI